jgi:hypothetical protein
LWCGESFHRLWVQRAEVSALPGALPQPSMSPASHMVREKQWWNSIFSSSSYYYHIFFFFGLEYQNVLVLFNINVNQSSKQNDISFLLWASTG